MTQAIKQERTSRCPPPLGTTYVNTVRQRPCPCPLPIIRPPSLATSPFVTMVNRVRLWWRLLAVLLDGITVAWSALKTRVAVIVGQHRCGETTGWMLR